MFIEVPPKYPTCHSVMAGINDLEIPHCLYGSLWPHPNMSISDFLSFELPTQFDSLFGIEHINIQEFWSKALPMCINLENVQRLRKLPIPSCLIQSSRNLPAFLINTKSSPSSTTTYHPQIWQCRLTFPFGHSTTGSRSPSCMPMQGDLGIEHNIGLLINTWPDSLSIDGFQMRFTRPWAMWHGQEMSTDSWTRNPSPRWLVISPLTGLRPLKSTSN